MLTVTGTAIFGYRAWTKPELDGLSDLPAKPCDGHIRRETVQALLTPAESAVDRIDYDKAASSPYSVSRAVQCGINAENSVLLAKAEIVDQAPEDWGLKLSNGSGYLTWNKEENELHISTREDRAYIYLPCTPPHTRPGSPREQFGLTVSIELLYDHKPTGDELRRNMVKAAFEIAEGARKDLECRERTRLPAAAPSLDRR